MQIQTINGNDIIRVMLNNFSADLKNGKYIKKIDYNTWGYLKKATQIDIRFDNRNISVHSLLSSGVNHTCCFNYNDCGFGQFLVDNYLEEKTVGEETNLVYSNGGLYIKADDNWEPFTGFADVASITVNNAITCTKSNDQLDAIAYATSTDRLDNNSISAGATYTTDTTSNDYFNGSSISTSTTWTYPPNSVTVDGEKFVTKEEFYKEKEEDNMDTKKIFGSTFDFGPCGDTVRMSMYGLAVKNQNGEWVSYDTANNEIVNVEVFNFAEGGKWFYKMPVAVDDVAIGDLIIHAKKPCYVVGFSENTLNPIVVDIYSMEQKEILLPRNVFGFNYATKVVSLFNGLDMQQPTAKNPFGNMWMFALMGDGKSDDILPLMMMMQGNCGNMNPMLMYMMMSKDDSKIDPFMLMMLNGGMNMCGENK